MANPYLEIGSYMFGHCPKIMSDKYYLSMYYYWEYGRRINWESPKYFNEKLQWLKLYDRKDIYHSMVDKFEVKKFISERVGAEYAVPTLGIWDKFDDVCFDKLPDSFVLKFTFDSGSYYLCESKSKLDKDAARGKILSHWNIDFYSIAREWPYKGLKHRIIAEPLLATPNKLLEFKFYCFNGEPRFFQSITDRSVAMGGPILLNYWMDCKRMDMKDVVYICRQNVDFEILPRNFQKMIEICRILSKEMFFLRVDFYEANFILYVGELTFYENGGFCEFSPDEWNERLGDWIKLPCDKRNG